mmetsp:Transcript_35375/g.88748  ORF Transcript_35375/g.88748 Transcript_35375/m.88748 type:complete len:315 (-) Transcript_35375:269-1213(-)
MDVSASGCSSFSSSCASSCTSGSGLGSDMSAGAGAGCGCAGGGRDGRMRGGSLASSAAHASRSSAFSTAWRARLSWPQDTSRARMARRLQAPSSASRSVLARTPRSMASATAWLPFRSAMSLAVSPSSSCRWPLAAPVSSRQRTASTWPLEAAACSGVLPAWLAPSASAPSDSSHMMAGTLLLAAAQCSAVCPMPGPRQLSRLPLPASRPATASASPTLTASIQRLPSARSTSAGGPLRRAAGRLPALRAAGPEGLPAAAAEEEVEVWEAAALFPPRGAARCCPRRTAAPGCRGRCRSGEWILRRWPSARWPSA